MNGKKNPAVVCCRTASMILIVLCHIVSYYSFIPGHQFLPLVFNVGVHSFLLISGYLYGGKTIRDWKSWFYKRWKTVAMPALCMSIIVLLITLFSDDRPTPLSTALYLLNLQGLGFWFPVFTDIFQRSPHLVRCGSLQSSCSAIVWFLFCRNCAAAYVVYGMV